MLEQTPLLTARRIGANEDSTIGIDANQNEEIDAPVDGLKVDPVSARIPHREFDGSQRIAGCDTI